MLKFYSGSTSVVNSRNAVTDCLDRAFNESEYDCDLVIFHTTMGHDFNQILDEFKKLLPNAQVIGCTCAGIIGTEGPNEAMKSLAIMAVKGTDFEVTYVENIIGSNSYDVSVGLAKELKEKDLDPNMLLFLASGIDIAADRAIEGIESVFGGETPIIGGTSSDNMKAISNFQFIDGKIFQRGAILIAFTDPSLSIHSLGSHGFNPVGMPMVVTKSEGNRIYELDNRPAWDVYTERLGLTPKATLAEVLPVGAAAIKLKSELADDFGDSHILRAITKKEDDGSFYLPVDCHEGTKIELTMRDEDKIFDNLDKMLDRLVSTFKGKEPVAVFHTDCGARGRLMLNRVLKDEIVGKMQNPICNNKTVPWLGMYGFGEFTPIAGKNQFHNYTSSLYVVCRKK